MKPLIVMLILSLALPCYAREQPVPKYPMTIYEQEILESQGAYDSGMFSFAVKDRDWDQVWEIGPKYLLDEKIRALQDYVEKGSKFEEAKVTHFLECRASQGQHYTGLGDENAYVVKTYEEEVKDGDIIIFDVLCEKADVVSAMKFVEKNKEAHFQLARLYSQTHKLKEAISEYKKVLALDPGDGRSRNNLGIIYYESGMIEEAIVEYKQAIAVDSNDLLANFNLGRAYLKQSRYGESLVQFKKVIQIGPGSAVAKEAERILDEMREGKVFPEVPSIQKPVVPSPRSELENRYPEIPSPGEKRDR